MKKRFIVFMVCFAAILCFSSVNKAFAQIDSTQKEDLVRSLVFSAIFHVDAIEEGFLLYQHEKMAWWGSDAYQLSSQKGEVDLYFTYFTDSTMHTIFGNNKGEAVFEFMVDKKSLSSASLDTIRPMTEQEKMLYTQKRTMIETLQKLDEEGKIQISHPNPQYASFNIDVVRVNDTLSRLYILTGVFLKDVMPFGNDYALDFDNENNFLAFHTFHKNFYPLYKEDGWSADDLPMHSHEEEETPFITATDICNYYLYARDKYKIKSFGIYSPEHKCKYIFLGDEQRVIPIQDKEQEEQKEENDSK